MKMSSEVLWIIRKFRIPGDVDSLGKENGIPWVIKTSVLLYHCDIVGVEPEWKWGSNSFGKGALGEVNY